MSYKFGKKSINYWNWDLSGGVFEYNSLFKKWNMTEKDIQLEILKKWYPINTIGRTHVLIRSVMSPYKKVKIIGYLEFIWGYGLQIQGIEIETNVFCHPIKFIPDPDDKKRILREIKLNKIL
jgi:hypothetical protein